MLGVVKRKKCKKEVIGQVVHTMHGYINESATCFIPITFLFFFLSFFTFYSFNKNWIIKCGKFFSFSFTIGLYYLVSGNQRVIKTTTTWFDTYFFFGRHWQLYYYGIYFILFLLAMTHTLLYYCGSYLFIIIIFTNWSIW